MRALWLPLLVALMFDPQLCRAQSTSSEAARTTIGGQWFLSYRVGETGGEGLSGFTVDRGYIVIRHRLTEHLSGRITPDVSVDREGDGEGDLEMRLKYAYVDYAFADLGFFTDPHVEFGLVHRPWLDYEEHLAYYRVQGTMFLERNDIFNSGDYGATLFALLGGEMDDEYRERVNPQYPGRYGSFAVGLYNGGGYHGIERNKNKTLEGRLTLRPLPDVMPGLQFSYQGVYGRGNQVDTPDWTVSLLFASWESEHLVLTGQRYWGNGNFKGTAVDSAGKALPQDGFSLFTELRLGYPHLSLIARYDFFDEYPDGDGGGSKRLIVGVAYHIEGHSKLLLDYDVESRDGFETAESRLLKFGVEFNF
ncbi:MAG: hypothetical protein AMS18_02905 [Gemmatimonas sp. SG8_17]|nr:MAG: hypothetical protein AMS18_02905 [Gemmatimonas sp. SG8_17]